jgi:multiple sugar transport system permease protein
VILCVINALPFLWSIGVSFFHFRADRPNTPPHFIGFSNYVDLISDSALWEHFTNAGVMIASNVSIQLVVGAISTEFRKPSYRSAEHPNSPIVWPLLIL